MKMNIHEQFCIKINIIYQTVFYSNITVIYNVFCNNVTFIYSRQYLILKTQNPFHQRWLKQKDMKIFMHINEMVNFKIKQGSEYMPFLCYFKIYFLKYMYSLLIIDYAKIHKANILKQQHKNMAGNLSS